jgi:hypothetical protein
MTFGYCFGPCVARLATGWNELEPSRLNFFLLWWIFCYNSKGSQFSADNLICLNVAIFGYNCQIIVRVLAIANCHRDKFRLPSTKNMESGNLISNHL